MVYFFLKIASGLDLRFGSAVEPCRNSVRCHIIAASRVLLGILVELARLHSQQSDRQLLAIRGYINRALAMCGGKCT